MTTFRNILCVAPTPVEYRAALHRAMEVAATDAASLTVVDVAPAITAGTGTPPTFALQAALVQRRREELESVVARWRSHLDIRIEVRVGTMFLEVIRTVLERGHDLVVKPAESPAFIDRLFGSADMHLLRKCPCPVWLTRPDDPPRYACVLAAVDFPVDAADDAPSSELNHRILDHASGLAIAAAAELHVVHAWDAPAELTVRSWANDPEEAGRTYVNGECMRHERALHRFCDEWRTRLLQVGRGESALQRHLIRGTAASVIPEAAARLKADLVVMGTVGRTGIAGLFIGNTAETILEQLRCSVLAIKPAGFTSPVRLPE